jgi:hypothetical protein
MIYSLKFRKLPAYTHQTIMFLKSLDRFKSWGFDDLTDLVKAMEIHRLEKDIVLYDIGDKVEFFYIILEGAVFLETLFDTSKQIRYPIGVKTWETKITHKKSKLYKVIFISTIPSL